MEVDLENVKELFFEKERRKQAFYKIQAEKKFYLGEYKERVLIALTKKELEEGVVYPQILQAMTDERAYSMKMRRSIKLKYFRPYIKKAEELKFKYELLDGISYTGNIGLVIVSKEALAETIENPIVEDIQSDFDKSGLEEKHFHALGDKICRKCKVEIDEKLPKYSKKYKILNLLDRMFGWACPICGE